MFNKLKENKVFRLFFPKKEKPVEEQGALGHYNVIKAFDQIKYTLIYTNEKLIYNNDQILVYTRNYKDTTFVNVLVFDEIGLDIDKFHYDNLKPLLQENEVVANEKSIVIVFFQHKNENTISLAKKFCKSDKMHFEQGLIYNTKLSQVDYYKPVPDFYKLYTMFCEDIYFDLGLVDPYRN